MPANRIVALFTPVIALAAGAAATWIADIVPGLDSASAGEMEALFFAGLAAVLAPAAQWLYGAQKFERHEAELENQALEADTQAAARESEVGLYGDEPGGYGPEDEFEDDYDDGYDDDPEPEDDDDEVFETALAEDEQPVPAGG